LRSWSNLKKAFVTNVWDFREKAGSLREFTPPPFYRPMFTVLFTVEYQVFGLQPQGWHLVNLLLHILCSFFVYQILYQLSKNHRVAVIASLLFAVYSVHVESVSWISGVTDPLYCLFLLPAFYLYLKFRETNRRLLWFISLGLYSLATFSKETALCLVGLIFLYEFVATDEEGEQAEREVKVGWVIKTKTAILAAFPYLCVALFYLLCRYLALGALTWKYPRIYQGPAIHTLWTLPWVVCSYLLHLFFPIDLTIAYNTSFVTSPFALRFLIPALFLILAVAALTYYRRQINKQVWYALILLFVPLLLALNLKQLPAESLIVDRYLYLSVAGWTYLIALGLSRLAVYESPVNGNAKSFFNKFQPVGLSSALVIILALFLTVATAKENRSWSDIHALWNNAAKIRPDYWAVRYENGVYYLQEERFPEAMDCLIKAAELEPERPIIHNALAQAYAGLGETESAGDHFRKAVTLNPDFYEAWNNLGILYFNQGDYATAEPYLKRAVDLKPDAAEFLLNLGSCHSRLGRYAEAIPELERGTQLRPQDAESLYELGFSYEMVGKKTEALATLHKAMSFRDSLELSQKIVAVINRLEK
jgi:protein O-mannosyl-transferase